MPRIHVFDVTGGADGDERLRRGHRQRAAAPTGRRVLSAGPPRPRPAARARRVRRRADRGRGGARARGALGGGRRARLLGQPDRAPAPFRSRSGARGRGADARPRPAPDRLDLPRRRRAAGGAGRARAGGRGLRLRRRSRHLELPRRLPGRRFPACARIPRRSSRSSRISSAWPASPSRTRSACSSARGCRSCAGRASIRSPTSSTRSASTAPRRGKRRRAAAMIGAVETLLADLERVRLRGVTPEAGALLRPAHLHDGAGDAGGRDPGAGGRDQRRRRARDRRSGPDRHRDHPRARPGDDRDAQLRGQQRRRCWRSARRSLWRQVPAVRAGRVHQVPGASIATVSHHAARGLARVARLLHPEAFAGG